MKSIFKVLGLAALFVAFTTNVNAQASETADATARILSSAGIVAAAGDAGDLDWGDILPGSLASVVDIEASAAGTRTLTSGDASLVTSDIGNAAEFVITGTDGQGVTLSLTSSSITLDNGPNSMDAVLDLSSTSATLTGGTATIYVGGALDVAVGQASGSYATTFEVNVAY